MLLCDFPLIDESQARLFHVAPTVQVTGDVLIRGSADASGVTYVDHRGGVDNLWSQPLDGSAARQRQRAKSKTEPRTPLE
jgi:hypothetical protein